MVSPLVSRLLLVGLSPLALTGCNLGCGLELRPDALVVQVTDARTGLPAAAGATVRVTLPNTVLELTAPGDAGSIRADSAAFFVSVPAGTYRVTASKPGFQDWTDSLVVVRRDGCNSAQTTVSARLQPKP